VINILMGLFLATLISELFTTRLYRLFAWYAINSLMLGLIAIYNGNKIDDSAMIIAGILTLIFKFIIIPYILKYFVGHFGINRKVTPSVPIHYAIILVPLMLVFTFYLITPIIKNFTFTSNYVAIAISALFLSLVMIIEHKDMLSKIIGFLSIENSLFLLGITATNGMPMLVELGIFFDLMMFIVVINLLFKYQGEQ